MVVKEGKDLWKGKNYCIWQKAWKWQYMTKVCIKSCVYVYRGKKVLEPSVLYHFFVPAEHLWFVSSISLKDSYSQNVFSLLQDLRGVSKTSATQRKMKNQRFFVLLLPPCLVFVAPGSYYHRSPHTSLHPRGGWEPKQTTWALLAKCCYGQSAFGDLFPYIF